MQRSGVANQRMVDEVLWWYRYKYDCSKMTLAEQLEPKEDGTEYWFLEDFKRFDAWRAAVGGRKRRLMRMNLLD